jgi:hypothetical protein
MALNGVTGIAENGTDSQIGMLVEDGAVVTAHDSAFVGRGGRVAAGLWVRDKTELVAEDIVVLSEGGSETNLGLFNGHATVVLHGAEITCRGGSDAYAIQNNGAGTTLEAADVTAYAEEATGLNAGLWNHIVAKAVLRGGTYAASDGNIARGIYNHQSADLIAHDIDALGEGGAVASYGLDNVEDAIAQLYGGTYVGQDSLEVAGIENDGTTSILDPATIHATGITARGVNGSSNTYGVFSIGNDATADITQSVIEGATNSAYVAPKGTMTLSHTRLIGTASSEVVCVLVTRGAGSSTNVSTDGDTCP